MLLYGSYRLLYIIFAQLFFSFNSFLTEHTFFVLYTRFSMLHCFFDLNSYITDDTFCRAVYSMLVLKSFFGFGAYIAYNNVYPNHKYMV